MLQRFTERTLYLLLGLVGLTIAIFWISESGEASIDMAQLLGDEPFQQLNSNEAVRNQLRQIKQRRGADLPIFYFTLGQAGDDPAVKKIAIPREQSAIRSLANNTGQPDKAMQWHHYLLNYEQQCNSSASFEKLKELRSATTIAGITRILQSQFEPGAALREEFSGLFQTRIAISKLIPHLWWNGSYNRWHRWVFGLNDQMGILQGNWGTSQNYGRPVSSLLMPAFGRTLRFALPALMLGLIAGIFIALSGTSRNKPPGHRNFLLLLFLIPSFWLGSVLLTVFCSPLALAWFPPAYSLAPSFSEGGLGAALHRSFLPTLVWTTAIAGYTGLIALGALEKVQRHSYFQTAYAKGLSNRRVAWQHRLPVIALTLLAVFQQIAPLLFAGSVAIEVIFSINGIGKLTYDALLAHDNQVVFAAVSIIGALTLLISWLTDSLSAIIDPRTRKRPA